MAVRDEPEMLNGRRAFPKAQQLLAGVPLRRLPGTVAVGWHDGATHAEQGAFAVVGTGAGLDDLIGEVVRVSAGAREVFVYVVAARPVPVALSLWRRAFFPSLGLLAVESKQCIVEVVE
jgi:hypothetical protein